MTQDAQKSPHKCPCGECQEDKDWAEENLKEALDRLKAMEAENWKLVGENKAYESALESSQRCLGELKFFNNEKGKAIQDLRTEVERLKAEVERWVGYVNNGKDKLANVEARLAEAVRVLKLAEDCLVTCGDEIESVVSDSSYDARGRLYQEAKSAERNAKSLAHEINDFLQSPTNSEAQEREKRKDFVIEHAKHSVRQHKQDCICGICFSLKRLEALDSLSSEASKGVHSVCSAHQEREPDCRACNTYIGGVVMPEASGGCEHDGGGELWHRHNGHSFSDFTPKKDSPTCPFCKKFEVYNETK